MFEKIFDPIFNPLLNLGFFWAILIISFVITLLITLIYKFTTDQNLMKKLKAEMKSLQAEMKKVKSNPQKAMKHQKVLMQKNMSYMKLSLKPTLYTFIPIIIIFGWLNAHMAYLPIEPNTDFLVSVDFKEGTFGEVSLTLPELTILSQEIQSIENNHAEWTLNGEEGTFHGIITFGNREFERIITISSENNYEEPITKIKDSDLTTITIHNEKVRPLGNFGLFGWKPGWIGTYIIFSLIFSLLLRKLMKIS